MPTTYETVKLARKMMKYNVDAISVVTPYYIRPNDDSLLTHYK